MKKFLLRALLFLLVAVLSLGGLSALADMPKAGEQVSLNVLVRRHDGTTTDASELWFFKYMEYWFAQQGYNVKINVQQTAEPAQQIALLLGTDSLPDVIWAISLGRSDVMQYGVEDGMILNWAPYIEKGLLPNLSARFEELPIAKLDATAPDGGIYALPYFAPSLAASGCYGTSERLYYRQSWLDACDRANPTTQQEFLDTLRAFKNMKLENGQQPIPLVSADKFLEKYLWTCLGFYGTEPNQYGYNLMIKDGEIVMPAYTPAYKDFIEIMHTLYTEGLIPEDYFSMKTATAGGLMKDGVCGALCYWTLEYVGDDFADIVCSNPILLGDNDEVYVSRLSYFTSSTVWASSETKYPEIVAMLADFVYSDDGAFLYRYGPKAGEDPLGLVDGWYYDEKTNDVTTKLVADGTYASISAYGRDRLFPHDNAGLRPAVVTSGTGEMLEYKDAVTGTPYYVLDNAYMNPDTNDGHWRLSTIEKWSDHATSIRLPSAYLNSDDSAEATELITVLKNYITKESAAFITGQRPLSEIDDFQQQMKKLGVEEYLSMYRAAYADFLAETFGK